MDAIIISDLEVLFQVGVTEVERAKPQRLLLSLEIEHSLGRAAAKDDLSQTIDYYTVCQRLLRFGEGREWRLIETLAVDIASVIIKEFLATSVLVEVKKFIIPETRYVAVRIRRP